MKPRLRRPDIVKPDPHRDYLREHCPPGNEGFVAEDLDLVVRRFGTKFGTDADGQFALIEVKHGTAPLGPSKERTFKLIDDLLSAQDPWAERYLGMYLLRFFKNGDEPWSDEDPVVFGKSQMTAGDYRRWLLGETIPYDITPIFVKARQR
jgi:hypothetical protein